MKRFVTLAVIVMILAMIHAVASAEVLYQKNFYELALSDDWRYSEDHDWYTRKGDNGIVILRTPRENITGTSDVDAVVAEMLRNVGTDADHASWEPIVVDGQDTVLITFTDGGLTFYATAIRNDDSACYALYTSEKAAEEKALFMDMLDHFYVRPANEASSFRFGNADVKLLNYRTKTVGGKMYLLVDLRWKNAGTKADMFVVNVDVKAYQDGIELHDGYLFDVSTETGTSIMPGKELTVTEVFQLRSKTGTITVVLDKLMDVLNEWPSKTYEYQLK